MAGYRRLSAAPRPDASRDQCGSRSTFSGSVSSILSGADVAGTHPKGTKTSSAWWHGRLGSALNRRVSRVLRLRDSAGGLWRVGWLSRRGRRRQKAWRARGLLPAADLGWAVEDRAGRPIGAGARVQVRGVAADNLDVPLRGLHSSGTRLIVRSRRIGRTDACLSILGVPSTDAAAHESTLPLCPLRCVPAGGCHRCPGMMSCRRATTSPLSAARLED
jgi:hypothetical protein